eukprot:GHVH01005031.1.p1 GENE.GHVH01005031.1~~GHVH01005031.1.p1  ORF type:complete len:180 (+),score=35.10 GHVH01005031.1:623-1162(+)
MKQCALFIDAIDSSFLLYGCEDSMVNLTRCGQVRVHDADRLHLAMESDKKPIFEKCSNITLSPPLVASYLKDSSVSSHYEVQWIEEWSRDVKRLVPVDFSTQYLRDDGDRAIRWSLGCDDEFHNCTLLFKEDANLEDATSMALQTQLTTECRRRIVQQSALVEEKDDIIISLNEDIEEF